MMIKAQKVEFVKRLKQDIKKYKTVGVMPLDALPDRLTQKVRNQLKGDTTFVVARKSLIMRAIEGSEETKRLEPFITGNVALVLSNKDPVELHQLISSNKLKLGAKPNQLSPEDIHVAAGETTIQPGQAVTDLKAGGIDVQIQKGKVVISKDKVVVKKGEKISLGVTKALKLLDIQPFSAQAGLSAVYSGSLLFTKQALAVTPAMLTEEIVRSFNVANNLTTQAGIVTQYNVSGFIRKAYLSALGVGLEGKVYEPGIVDKLIAQAVMQAIALNKVAPETVTAAPADAPKEEPKNA